jgi:peroxiredoxin
MAGDFVARNLQDKPARFREGRQGRVVLLNFWATWCPPCRKEMPAMEQLYQAYRDKGLVVVAVSQDQAPLATVRRFTEELKLSFPVWHDRDGLVGKQYSIPGVPASYLIGRDGRVAYKVLGEYDWFSDDARAAVEQLLAADK